MTPEHTSPLGEPGAETSRGHWLRGFGLAVACVLGLLVFHGYADDHYPLRHWLAWRVLGYCAASLVFGFAALSAGHVTMRAIAGERLPALEHTAFAFAVGVLEFKLLLFLGALFQLLYWWYFFVPPALMLLVGARPFLAFARQNMQLYSGRPLALWQGAAVVFGLACLGLIYFNLLTPDNVSFDSRAMHLGIAEDYVASHGLRRFGEGWVFAGAPHLGSFLYTWVFLVPGARLHDQMVLAQHLELVVFMGTTLFGIAAVVGRLVPNVDPRVTWVARFLFPGVMLYDSSLSAGADHLAAMYGPVIFLALLLTWQRFEVRYSMLLGALLAGAVMTKYTMGMMTLPFVIGAVGFRMVSLATAAARKPRGQRGYAWLLGPLAVSAAAIIVGAPHWAKNLIHYGDPAYPMLHGVLKPHPWLAGSDYLYKWGFQDAQLWAPTRDMAGLKETLRALLTFSFVPNDWPRFHGTRPVFGSLFTMLLPALLFLRGTKRVWALVVWVHLGVFAWYWVHHQDRYLQSLVPLMTAVVVAVIALMWRSRLLVVRLGVSALVVFQILWGADVYFFPTHSMISSPQQATFSLLTQGYKGQYEQRFGPSRSSLERPGKELPDGARVVVHNEAVTVGLGASSIRDTRPWQFGLDYAVLGSPAAVYDELSKLGATHVLWPTGRMKRGDSVGHELGFFNFTRHVEGKRTVGGFILGSMPRERPSAEFNLNVLLLGCSKKGYQSGMYQIGDLNRTRFAPEEHDLEKPRIALKPEDGIKRLAEVGSAVTDSSCSADLTQALSANFEVAGRTTRGTRFPEYHYWIRRE